MADTAKDLDAYIEAVASVLELTIEPAWKSSVRENLNVVFAHAQKVAEFPLPDEAEPAPVFRA